MSDEEFAFQLGWKSLARLEALEKEHRKTQRRLEDVDVLKASLPLVVARVLRERGLDSVIQDLEEQRERLEALEKRYVADQVLRERVETENHVATHWRAAFYSAQDQLQAERLKVKVLEQRLEQAAEALGELEQQVGHALTCTAYRRERLFRLRQAVRSDQDQGR